MKIFYYDVETCGLNHKLHSVHQLSAIIEVDGVVKERLDFRIAPHPKSKFDAMAMSVGGVTPEIIKTYPELSVQFHRLKTTLLKYVSPYDKHDKFYRCGFNNAQFDNNFLLALFELNSDTSHFNLFFPESLDVLVMAASYLAPIRHTMPSFKLKRVAMTVGIAVDKTKLHDAMYDVELTREIYLRLPKPQIETFDELD